MIIIKTDKFKKTYKKYLVNKHKTEEIRKLEDIENIIIKYNNLQDLLTSPYKKFYYIEKKTGNLKEIYTARLNSKIRLYMRPVGEYPYNEIEIDEIVFEEIDEKHYKEG
ncbi:MAG: hypothetical protein J6O56_02470 [Bacilli bacterium]|nr:hypothetical protein [Bacilli bacterium]